MTLSANQAALHFRTHGIEREDAPKKHILMSLPPIQWMAAFATCMSKGLEQYWNVPANDPQIRAEIDLLPKRML